MALYCGIDLHSNNHVVVVIDEDDQRIFERRLGNDLALTLNALEPYRSKLAGVAVESTFNWYWLVDGLQAAGYPMRLVNTTAVQQYAGLKYMDDRYDAYWLAHLMRLGILPTGYIYPKEQRGIRDLLRRRMQLVQTASSAPRVDLHFQDRYRLGLHPPHRAVNKRLEPLYPIEDSLELHPALPVSPDDKFAHFHLTRLSGGMPL